MLPAMTCVLPYIDSYTTRARMLITSSSRVALSPSVRARKRQEPTALITGTKAGSRGTRPGGSVRLCGDPAVSGPRRLALPGHGRRHDVRGAGPGVGRPGG